MQLWNVLGRHDGAAAELLLLTLTATVRVLPAYPGWAKEGHPVVCTIELGVTPPTTTCQSTP